MLQRLVIIGLVFIILGAIFADQAIRKSDPFANMRWLETADPVVDFEEDKRQGNLKLKGVQGYALSVPGLDTIDYEMCYSRHVNIDVVDPTGDSLAGDEHIILKGHAGQYAASYNELLIKYLIDNGKTDCDSDEDWNVAFDEMNDMLGWPNGSQLGHVGISADYISVGIRDIQRAESLARKFCEVLERNAVKREILIGFVHWTRDSRTDYDKKEYEYLCHPGKLRSELQ